MCQTPFRSGYGYQRGSSGVLSERTPSLLVIEGVLHRLSRRDLLLSQEYHKKPRPQSWNNSVRYSSMATPPHVTFQVSTRSGDKVPSTASRTSCLDLRLIQADDLSRPSMFRQLGTKKPSSRLGVSSSSNSSGAVHYLGSSAKAALKAGIPLLRDTVQDRHLLIKSSPTYNKYIKVNGGTDAERAIYSESSSSSNAGFWLHELEDCEGKWSQSTPLQNRLQPEVVTSPVPNNKRNLFEVSKTAEEPPRVKRVKLYAHIQRRSSGGFPKLPDPEPSVKAKKVNISGQMKRNHSEEESSSLSSVDTETPPKVDRRSKGSWKAQQFGCRVKHQTSVTKKKSIRSKTGCWTCRIRHKSCPEEKPVCAQCTRLALKCDYSAERPNYMYEPTLRARKLSEIKNITTRQKSLVFSSIRRKKRRKIDVDDSSEAEDDTSNE